MEPNISAEEFCRYMWKQYLVERRYDILTEMIDPELSVIGTGAHEFCRDMEAFAASMARESREWDGAFLIKNQWYQTTPLSPEFSLVIGEIVAKEDARDGILFDIRFRFSIVLRKTQGGWKLVHVHQSVPDANQAYDEFFPHRMLEKNSQQVVYNLRHDTMTGLLNRLYLKHIVDRSMETGPQGYMLMLDVDTFKQLNDTYGHPFGDRVLILLAQSLKSMFPNGAAGRIGGDEFVIYLAGEITDEQLKTLLCEFKRDWAESQRALDLPCEVTVSIGVARCPQAGVTFDAVWQRADEALYQAKNAGRNKVRYLI